MRTDPWLTRLRALIGTGILAWELAADQLHHWPPTFVLAAWLLGAPIERLIRFFTEGRLQINVRGNDDEGPDR